MLNIIALAGKYWYALAGKYWYIVAIIVWTGIVFGYGYKVRGDKCDKDMRIAAEMFQAQANEQSAKYEEVRSKTSTNKERVIYAKKTIGGDCLVTANKLQIFNAAFNNDTSKFN
jgi:hypothetical protein